MTAEQGFRLVTRALAVYCLYWLATEVLYLPVDAMGLLHHMPLLRQAKDTGRFVSEESYWVRYYLELTCMRIVLGMVSLWLAASFYRGTDGVRKFFMVAPQSASVPGEEVV